jgi:hypothetical protein
MQIGEAGTALKAANGGQNAEDKLALAAGQFLLKLA